MNTLKIRSAAFFLLCASMQVCLAQDLPIVSDVEAQPVTTENSIRAPQRREVWLVSRTFFSPWHASQNAT